MTDAPTFPAPNTPSAVPFDRSGNHAEFHAMPTVNAVPREPEQRGEAEQFPVLVTWLTQNVGTRSEQQQERHHVPPAVAVGPDAEVQPRQRPGEDGDGEQPVELRGREVQLVADLDAEDAEHQPDGEQQGERDRGQPQHPPARARRVRSRCGGHAAPSGSEVRGSS